MKLAAIISAELLILKNKRKLSTKPKKPIQILEKLSIRLDQPPPMI